VLLFGALELGVVNHFLMSNTPRHSADSESRVA